MSDLTPYDGDLNPTKIAEYEALMDALKCELDDENAEISISAFYDSDIRQMDYSKLEIVTHTPKYFHDRETDETFIEDVDLDASIVSVPPELIKQVENLFADGVTVYFCLKSSLPGNQKHE